MNYDYIIVGGGPTGLTLAWCLANYGKKIILIEKKNTLGGCHHVARVDGLFSEHGPRIYIENFFILKQLLNEMNLCFYDLFTPYNFDITYIGGNVFSILSWCEIFKLTLTFLNMNDTYKSISVEEYLNKNNFSNKSKDYLDRLCRLTDGAGIKRFTLYNFLQLINQNFFYRAYQPNKPTDVSLFKHWKEKLLEKGVKILLNTEVTDLTTQNNKIISIMTSNNQIFKGRNFIFAIPPDTLINLLIKSRNLRVKNAFGELNNLVKWNQQTNYITYIPITFHWEKKLDLPKVWGFSSTAWNIAFIVLTDYMEFDDYRSKTVITVTTTNNNISDYTHKTPDQTKNKNELAAEIFRQLKQTYLNLPYPDHTVFTQNYHDGQKWISKDTGFITTKHGYLKNKSIQFDNLYSCGTHNGHSDYNFTSFEAAAANAIHLVNELVPESKKKYQVLTPTTILNVLWWIILIIIIVVVVVVMYLIY
jgi:NAD(P)-binding Rossmann-like domain